MRFWVNHSTDAPHWAHLCQTGDEMEVARTLVASKVQSVEMWFDHPAHIVLLNVKINIEHQGDFRQYWAIWITEACRVFNRALREIQGRISILQGVPLGASSRFRDSLQTRFSGYENLARQSNEAQARMFLAIKTEESKVNWKMEGF